jgi:hypothetical protein
VNDAEVLLFLERVAAKIDNDMGLGLSVPARRRIVQRVLDSEDYENAVETAHFMMGLLLGERTLN